MEVCILLSSPRKNGNTGALCAPFRDELERLGHRVSVHWLCGLDIRPCTACRSCQSHWTGMGCSIQDDVPRLAEKILKSDLLVLATPIYSWYCTPPMKALLDRLVYGLNKYYGKEKGPSLWRGKRMAILTTCGYPPEKGADLFQEGMRRYCRHSQLSYAGMLAQRHLGYDTVFMDREKERQARAFARKLAGEEEDAAGLREETRV